MAKRRKSSGRAGEAGESATAIKVALIGGAATLLAAIIGGFFVLSSGTGDSSSVSSSSSSSSHPGLEQLPSILTVSFANSHTKEIVIVKGVAPDISPNEALYAVATPQQTGATPSVEGAAVEQSWFVGGPAHVGHGGLWAVEIDIAPPSSHTLTVVAVITANTAEGGGQPPAGGVSDGNSTGPPFSTAPSLSPAPPLSTAPHAYTDVRSNLRAFGPQADEVIERSSTSHAKPGY
jgi:hypothetical protein